MKINLMSYEAGFFAGVILRHPTGVVFSNQVGGIACKRPRLEGVFLPIPPIDSTTDALRDECCLPGDPGFSALIVEYTDNYLILIRDFLESEDLTDFLSPPTPEVLHEWGIAEAWIPVRVKQAHSLWPPFNGFKGRHGIITYPNSD